MLIWKRAAGALKDQNSILATTFTKRKPYRNPDIKKVIIRATSHDDARLDYRNVNRVFSWIRISPVTLKPLLWALTCRMEKTRSWVVALKGLILMHGVFCCKTPAVQKIGRLPFDLSSFSDGHSSPSKIWGFNALVRTYFAFLDQKAAFQFVPAIANRNHNIISKSNGMQIVISGEKAGDDRGAIQATTSMLDNLEKLQNWECLLDLLLQIKPLSNNMRVRLIVEAMDCVIIEIFDVCAKICEGVVGILKEIDKIGKSEAGVALRVLRKAAIQGHDLQMYFQFCKEFGVPSAMEVPKITEVPDSDIRDLEVLINEASDSSGSNLLEGNEDNKAIVVRNEDGAMVEVDTEEKDGSLKTIITEKWEMFEQEDRDSSSVHDPFYICKDVVPAASTDYNRPLSTNPFESPPHNDYLPIVPVAVYQPEIPDLMSF